MSQTAFAGCYLDGGKGIETDCYCDMPIGQEMANIGLRDKKAGTPEIANLL